MTKLYTWWPLLPNGDISLRRPDGKEFKVLTGHDGALFMRKMAEFQTAWRHSPSGCRALGLESFDDHLSAYIAGYDINETTERD